MIKGDLTYTKTLAFSVFLVGIPMSAYFNDPSVLVNMTYASAAIIAARAGGKFANKYGIDK